MKYASKADTKKVIEALKANPDMTYKSIADKLGRTWASVGSVAKRYGLQHGRSMRPRHFSGQPKRIYRMQQEGRMIKYVQNHPEMTYAEIADYFKVPASALSGLLYRRGIRRSAVTDKAKAKQKEVADYVAAHPNESYSDIGRKLDLPTLRIANIARKHGLFRGKGQGPRHNNGRAGYTRTPEEREHLSRVMLDIWANVSPNHKQRLSRIMKGSWTDERKHQFSLAVKRMWREAKVNGEDGTLPSSN